MIITGATGMVGKAMVNAVLNGYHTQVPEVADIQKVSGIS